MQLFFRKILLPLATFLFVGLSIYVSSNLVQAALPNPLERGYCPTNNCTEMGRGACSGDIFFPGTASAEAQCKAHIATPTPPTAQGFIPLTNLPGLVDDEGKRTLADYLNVLFRLAIGIGALIAVIQITLAGIKYMGTDAFSSKEEAKKDIRGALLGLLIMLSTVVILKLIYPDILNLNVLQKLGPVKVQNPSGSGGPVTTGTSTTLNRPNGETCAVNPNCQSGYCDIPPNQTVGTCKVAPAQIGLPKGAECNPGQQPNPCVAPFACIINVNPQLVARTATCQ